MPPAAVGFKCSWTAKNPPRASTGQGSILNRKVAAADTLGSAGIVGHGPGDGVHSIGRAGVVSRLKYPTGPGEVPFSAQLVDPLLA